MVGSFIVFEGIDGSGKSTVIKSLSDFFLQSGYSTLTTKEPTDDRPVGRFIQQYLLADVQLPEYSEALLFIADRLDHTENVIKPALEEYDLVFCSHYKWATLAYQARNLKERNKLESMQSWTLRPDLAIYLDVTPKVGIQRTCNKKDITINIERQTAARCNYMEYVWNGELSYVNTELLDKEKVFEQCAKMIEKMLRQKN